MPEAPKIIAAAAALILPNRFSQDNQHGQPHAEDKYFVHPHVAKVGSEESALSSYLYEIYTGNSASVATTQLPKSPAFTRLQHENLVQDATREIAEELRLCMEKVRANAGVVFGFLLRLSNETRAFGLIKADIEDDRRFYMDLTKSSQWTIGQVDDLLPAPRAHYAKYVIAPQPRGSGTVGIRDTQAQRSAAAAYLLKAIGATMPRNEGTKATVAREAADAGYRPPEIRRVLSDLAEDTPTVELIEKEFPEIEPAALARLQGTQERPMPIVRAEEPLITTWSTRHPSFELKVDASVNVTIDKNVVTVTLPANHDEIKPKYR